MNDFTSTSFYGDDETGDLRGPKGDTGDTGAQGPIGPRGEKGETGRTGATATDGIDGKNAVYRFGMFAIDGIQPSEILLDHIVAQACTMGIDFSGSVASCGTAPEDLWVATVSLNGATIGTLTIAVGGVASLKGISTLPLPLVPGDIVSLTAPETADLAIGRVRITFTGEL